MKYDNRNKYFIAIMGCFIGLARFLRNYDRKIATDSEWKGGVDEIDYIKK